MINEPKPEKSFSKLMTNLSHIVIIVGFFGFPTLISFITSFSKSIKCFWDSTVTIPLWLVIYLPFIFGLLFWLAYRCTQYRRKYQKFKTGDKVIVIGTGVDYIVDGYNFWGNKKVICKQFSHGTIYKCEIREQILEKCQPL
jgi:uncharacterized integral membrane protein